MELQIGFFTPIPSNLTVSVAGQAVRLQSSEKRSAGLGRLAVQMAFHRD